MQTDTLSMMTAKGIPAHVQDLRTLFVLTDRLYRSHSKEEVCEAALDAIVSALGCTRASILLFDAKGTMRFVAWKGLSEAYRRAVDGHSPWRQGDSDPEPIFIRDIEKAQGLDGVIGAIRDENIRALGFIPLAVRGRVAGKFMTYYERPHDFTAHEIELGVLIARQLGFSIERSLAEEARARSEEQLRESEERFRLMSENAPVMIWLSDADGSCLHLNRLLRQFWNVTDEDIATFSWKSSMHPDDAPMIGAAMFDALRRQAPTSIKGRYFNAGGRCRILQTDAQPRFAPSGEFLGMIGVNIDITDREDAEHALRLSQSRLAAAFRIGKIGIYDYDLRNQQAENWDSLICRLWGIADGEALTDGVFWGRIHPLDVPALKRAIASGMEPDGPRHYQSQFRVSSRNDGETRWAHIEAEVTFDGQTPVRILGTLQDITESKRAEEHIRLLMREVNHRSKNLLAVVQAIAGQTAAKGDPQLFARRFGERLKGLSLSHDLLIKNAWEGADLRELILSQLSHFGEAVGRRIILRGPPLLVRASAAQALGLALHELSTNAGKYGSLSIEGGTAEIAWTVMETAGAPHLRMSWSEQGGPPVAKPSRHGFGTLLITDVVAKSAQGEVTLDYPRSGIRWSFVAPLDRILLKEGFGERPAFEN